MHKNTRHSATAATGFVRAAMSTTTLNNTTTTFQHQSRPYHNRSSNSDGQQEGDQPPSKPSLVRHPKDGVHGRRYAPRHKDAPQMSRPRRDMLTRVAFNSTTDKGSHVEEPGETEGMWQGRGGITPGRKGSKVQQEARRAIDTAHGYSHSVHYRQGDRAPGAKPPTEGGIDGEEDAAVVDGNDALPIKSGSYRDGMGLLISDEHPHGEYRPARRPSRLAQPVDIARVADTAMHRQNEAQRIMREINEAMNPLARRSIAAGEVPVETTVGNIFSVVLDACRSQGLLMASSFADSAPGPGHANKNGASTPHSKFHSSQSSSSGGDGVVGGNSGQSAEGTTPARSSSLSLRLKGTHKGPLVPPVLGARDIVAPPLEMLADIADYCTQLTTQQTSSPPLKSTSSKSKVSKSMEPKAASPPTATLLLAQLLSSNSMEEANTDSATKAGSEGDEEVESTTANSPPKKWDVVALLALEASCLLPVDDALRKYLTTPNRGNYSCPADAFQQLLANPFIEKQRTENGKTKTLSPLPASRLMQTSIHDAMGSDASGFLFSTLELQHQYWTFLLSRKETELKAALSSTSAPSAEIDNEGEKTSNNESKKSGDSSTSDAASKKPISLLHQEFANKALSTSIDRAYKCWDLVNSTPLASPNHGTLSLQGKAFAENTLVNDILLPTFPRLRAKMLQNIVAKLIASPLVTIRIANRLGITEQTNYGVEVGFYGDYILLVSQLRHFRELLRVHQRRSEKKIFPNQYEKYSKKVMSLEHALRAIPIDPDTLHLRFKWLHDLVFSFIGFTAKTEGTVVARALVMNLFSPAMGRYLHRRNTMQKATKVFEDSVLSSKLVPDTSLPDVMVTIRRRVQTALREAVVGTAMSSLQGGAGSGDVERLHGDLIRARELATAVNSLSTISLLEIENQHTPSASSETVNASILELKLLLETCKGITETWMTQHIPTGDDLLGNQSILSPATLHPLTQSADENVVRRTTAAGFHTSAGASDMEGGGGGNMMNMAEEDVNDLTSIRTASDHEAISALVSGGGTGIMEVLRRRMDDGSSSKSDDGDAFSLVDQLHLLQHVSAAGDGSAATADEVNDLAVRLLRFSIRNLSDLLPRPPVAITATTNSATPDAFREALLLLKYLKSNPTLASSSIVSDSPNVESGELEKLVQNTQSFEQYLDGEVYKRTDVVRANRSSAVDFGPPNVFNNVEFFVGNIYLYVVGGSSSETSSQHSAAAGEDGVDEEEEDDGEVNEKKGRRPAVRRFLLSVGRGMNPEEALQAAARNLLQRHYYNTSSSSIQL